MIVKRLIVTIDENGKPTIETEGKFSTMEFFGISKLISVAAESEENAAISAALAEEGEEPIAMAESTGRPGSGSGH